VIGGNLGDTIANFDYVKSVLTTLVDIEKVSSIYRSEPCGINSKYVYDNQGFIVNSPITPTQLLEKCPEIETKMGRIRTQKYEDRIIDIDIIAVQGMIINWSHLIIPHPHCHERNFVLTIWNELDADWKHEILNQKPSALLLQNHDKSIIEKLII